MVYTVSDELHSVFDARIDTSLTTPTISLQLQVCNEKGYLAKFQLSIGAHYDQSFPGRPNVRVLHPVTPSSVVTVEFQEHGTSSTVNSSLDSSTTEIFVTYNDRFTQRFVTHTYQEIHQRRPTLPNAIHYIERALPHFISDTGLKSYSKDYSPARYGAYF